MISSSLRNALAFTKYVGLLDFAQTALELKKSVKGTQWSTIGLQSQCQLDFDFEPNSHFL